MIIREARGYQSRDIERIEGAWFKQQKRCPLYTLPTGGGKTFVMAELARRAGVPVCVIAHRQELVGQISLALAAASLPHRILAADAVVRRIIRQHVKKFGRSYYDPRSHNVVAGVDTLIRVDTRDPVFTQTQIIMQDEGHHVLRSNKWGKGFGMFNKAARGLLVTATPERADGKGLGAHAAGIADDLIVGPTMQELIDQGYLTPFRMVGIPSDVARGELKVGASGDFTQDSMRKAYNSSKIVGDIPRHYLTYTPGKRGLTFVPDVEHAHAVADEYNKKGVPAKALSAKTPDDERSQAIDDLESGRLLQLVNVDLIGEGFDCPGVEVVSFGRWTESYAIYAQQFGRALRVLEGKKEAWILDHVGNVIRHNGPPTQPRIWTLDGKSGRSSAGASIPMRYCLNMRCAAPYERFHTVCPYCGTEPSPPERRSIETVDGDLVELDPETLNAIAAKVKAVDMDPDTRRRQLIASGVFSRHTGPAVDAHIKRQQSQQTLRGTMELWGGVQQARRRIDRRAAQKLFYLTFGVDVLNACALDYKEAEALTLQIMGDL